MSEKFVQFDRSHAIRSDTVKLIIPMIVRLFQFYHGIGVKTSHDLASVIYSNLSNIFRLVEDRIQHFVDGMPERSINLAAGFVLTGGVAMTRNIDKVLLNTNTAQAFGGYQSGQNSIKIRVGTSRGLVGISPAGVQKMATPDRAVCIGLLRQGYSLRLHHQKEQSVRDETEGGVRSFLSRLNSWVRNEL